MVDAESELIVGEGPAALLIVNRTMLDTAVVVVLETFCVGETAEFGISMATCTVPALVRSEAGTGAVSWTELTNVVVRAFPFHKMYAPETKPLPLAVIVKPCEPTVAEVGLTKLSVDEDV